MAEELQHLIDRIHREALDKAETEAAQILAQAKTKAAAVVQQAEEKARVILEKAEKDSQVFVERGRKTLEQAARDLLITVGQGIENILRDLVSEASQQALDIETLKTMLLTVAQAYAREDGPKNRIALLVSPADQEQIIAFFAEMYRQKLIGSVDIRADNNIFKGFKVRLVDEHIEHQFTDEAIAEALCNFLRPHMAEIVHRAARQTGANQP